MNEPPITGGPARFVSVAMLQNRWRTLCTSTLLTLGLVAGYLMITQPVYEAEVRIVLQKVNRTLDGKRANKTYDKEFLLTQAETIRSPLVLGESLRTQPSPGVGTSETIEEILENLRVNPLAGTDIIKVTYQYPQAEHARDRLKSIVESYEQRLRERESVEVRDSLILLKERAAEIAGDIKTRTGKIAKLQTRLDVHDSSGHLSPAVIEQENQLLKELASRRNQLRTERIRLMAIEPVRTRDAGDLSATYAALPPEFQRSTEVQNLRSQKETALAAEGMARKIYGGKHPERIAAENALAQINSRLRMAMEEAVNDVERKISQLRNEETAIETLMNEGRSRLNAAHRALQEQEQLLSELKRLEDLRTNTAANLESAQLADRRLQDGEMSIAVQVLDGYVIPDTAVWPQPAPLLFVGGCLGMLTGIAWILCTSSTLVEPPSGRTHAAQQNTSLQSSPEQELALVDQLRLIEQDLDGEQSGNRELASSRGELA